MVTTSTPVKALKTVKKTLLIDSADRDTTKYYTNGDFVVYLPRVYENVVSMRLAAAEFPPLVKNGTSPGACTHSYVNGSNAPYVFQNGSTNSGAVDQSGNYLGDMPLGTSATNLTQYNFPYYFLIDIEGMNKVDETTYSAQKSTFSDSFFAKIPATVSSTNSSQGNGAVNNNCFIEYNDHSAQENIARYSPAIGKLDRLHIRTRAHYQQDKNGFIYWTTDGAKATAGGTGTTQKGAEFCLSLEIEYLDNVFDDFSSLETHLTSRN